MEIVGQPELVTIFKKAFDLAPKVIGFKSSDHVVKVEIVQDATGRPVTENFGNGLFRVHVNAHDLSNFGGISKLRDELGHESTHVMNNSIREEVTQLEEGIATYFAREFMSRENSNGNEESYRKNLEIYDSEVTKQYRRPFELVKSAFEANAEWLEKELVKSSRITEKTAIPGLKEDEATFCSSKFY